jgi:hypothetical protein
MSHERHRAYGCVALAVFATACAGPPPTPPEPAPPDIASFVSATFDLTWTAARDHLATAGIPLAYVDRGSGVITTERVAVPPSEAMEYADCGSAPGGAGAAPYLASTVVYDVAVMDEGSSSTVLVTASWNPEVPGGPFPCETKRVWEAEAQEAIRLAAEAKR